MPFFPVTSNLMPFTNTAEHCSALKTPITKHSIFATTTPEHYNDFLPTPVQNKPEELEWRAQHAQTHQIRMEHAQASRNGLGMLVIDIPKMQQQRLMNETDFIQWYVDDYMPEHLPEHHQPLNRKSLIKSGRNQAIQLGFTMTIGSRKHKKSTSNIGSRREYNGNTGIATLFRTQRFLRHQQYWKLNLLIFRLKGGGENKSKFLPP